MTLRDQPVVREAALPDGRTVEVRVVVPDDSYVPRDQVDTVVLELAAGDDVLGAVETVLYADERDEAVRLAQRVQEGLESGELEPTAEGVERLALTRPT